MRFAIKPRRIRLSLLVLAVFVGPLTADNLDDVLREAVKRNGFKPAAELTREIDSTLSDIGGELFASNTISLNGDISCKACHLDEFGSTDGIPIAIGVGGDGKGTERIEGGGAIIPRNTLPLWGVGGIDYKVLFWDGRVDFSADPPISQFGDKVPSQDPLVVAVHLPVLVIREMLIEDATVAVNKKETVDAAANIYNAIAGNLRTDEPSLAKRLADYKQRPISQLEFEHVAEAIAEFIRDRFRLRSTKFHEFVFEGGQLEPDERRGAELFYGKGRCANCHSGAFLTDFDFHTVAMAQIGFGPNGFGIDYGRYNVTHDPADLYKFRTPPLFNITKTEPYGHSGNFRSLENVIISHFDPLRFVQSTEMTAAERTQYYKVLMSAADSSLALGQLTDDEVKSIVAFLDTLEFEPE